MIKEHENGISVTLKIVPNSSKNEIITEEGFNKVKITAQAIENKANKALIEFLSKKFKIPKSGIEIIKGELSRDKTIFFKTSDLLKIQSIKNSFI